MMRLSGLVEHFMRRISSVMRSKEGTSSKFAEEAFAIFDLPRVFLPQDLDYVERAPWVSRTTEVVSGGQSTASNTSRGLTILL